MGEIEGIASFYLAYVVIQKSSHVSQTVSGFDCWYYPQQMSCWYDYRFQSLMCPLIWICFQSRIVLFAHASFSLQQSIVWASWAS
jgi:hypothetical protein